MANDWFSQDKPKFEQKARDMLGDTPVTQSMFNAIYELNYNVAPAFLTQKASPNLNQAIKNRDYEAIMNNLVYTKATNKNGQKVTVPALQERSAERQAIFNGNYPAN